MDNFEYLKITGWVEGKPNDVFSTGAERAFFLYIKDKPSCIHNPDKDLQVCLYFYNMQDIRKRRNSQYPKDGFKLEITGGCQDGHQVELSTSLNADKLQKELHYLIRKLVSCWKVANQ